MKTIIIALGGNALIKEGQKGTSEEQFENLREPTSQIAELSKKHKIIITHGNGPQVGNILLRQACDSNVQKMPLDICVAQSQGQIGYMIEHVLDEELIRLGISKEKLFLTVLSYAKVDPEDPAFKNPTKPIGPAYPENRSEELGYEMRKTSKGWRRVVPSPKPLKTYQKREIRRLLEDNFIVITCGGGGIPVFKRDNKLTGVEAVIDKDFASAKLGEEVGADILLIVTDVEGAALNFEKPNQEFLKNVKLSELKKYQKEGHFPDGSMGPKVQAVINFLESGGERAVIAHLGKIHEAVGGSAGTQITR